VSACAAAGSSCLGKGGGARPETRVDVNGRPRPEMLEADWPLLLLAHLLLQVCPGRCRWQHGSPVSCVCACVTAGHSQLKHAVTQRATPTITAA
jgi:hypothetical protein